eukprot:s3522_g4.t1
MPLGRWNDDDDSSSCGGHTPAAGNRRRYDPTESSELASASDSASESLSSDSDSGSDVAPATSDVVELSLQRLQSLHATQKGSHHEIQNKYAKHGMSKSRLRRVLEKPPCQCGCSLPIRVLMMITQAFWRLTKPCQDSLLWSLQQEVGPGRKRWSMQGYPLCKDAWAVFLGVGKHRLHRCKKRFHGTDLRSIAGPGGPNVRPAVKTASATSFFVHMYWSAGETTAVLDHPKSLLEISDDQLRENLLARLIDAKLMGPGLQLGFSHEPEGLPERKLPHGNFATLYIMYQSFCKAAGEEPASRSVFYAVGKRWKVCLRFHKPSVHSKCWTCSTLKARIANAVDFQEYARLSDELPFHYSQQWKDRQVYWLARSRSRTERDVITMIIDSFDHCKLMLPRFPNRRTPKSSVYDSIKRTSMTLTCCICHGWGIYFFLADEGLPQGSNWTLEVAMKSIDYAWAYSRRLGKQFPAELWLQGDNACKEVRNSSVGQLACLLCQAEYFTSVTQAHLQVGHTHEDVDAALAVVTSALNGTTDIQTPRDLQRAIELRVAPLFRSYGMECVAEIVDTVRDWNQLMPGCVTLYNAYKGRKQKPGEEPKRVPQMFTFLRREDLPGDGYQLATEERVPKRLRVAGNSKDIFCLVKQNMSDCHLCQDPLLVYPAGLQASSAHFWDRIARNLHNAVIQQKLDGDRAAELIRLAKTLRTDFPHFSRTYQYYETLLDENRPRQALSKLLFIGAGPHAQSRVGGVQLGQRPAPPKPHHLKVVFHRG